MRKMTSLCCCGGRDGTQPRSPHLWRPSPCQQATAPHSEGDGPSVARRLDCKLPDRAGGLNTQHRTLTRGAFHQCVKTKELSPTAQQSLI